MCFLCGPRSGNVLVELAVHFDLRTIRQYSLAGANEVNYIVWGYSQEIRQADSGY